MAKAVLAKWKKTWYEATFGGEDGTGETPMGPAAAMMVKAVGVGTRGSPCRFQVVSWSQITIWFNAYQTAD